MRQPLPTPSDFTVKQLDAFAPGSLVFLPPANSASSQGRPAVQTAKGIVVGVPLDGATLSGVFLLDNYADRHFSYNRGEFLYAAGELEPFNLTASGIEVRGFIEVNPSGSIMAGSPHRPDTGEVGLAAGGAYISTLTGQVRAILDPSTWRVQQLPTPWPPTWAKALQWQAVWQCASGAEVVIPF